MAPRSTAYGSSPATSTPEPSGIGDGAPSSTTPAPAANHVASPVSVTIRSACSKTVPVFYGEKPRFSSGTTSSISSNSVQSKSFSVGDLMWVLDGNGGGLESVQIRDTTREIEIASGCTTISAR